MKNVFKTVGKIGAAALGLGALILAGKSEFGKELGTAANESAEDLLNTLKPLDDGVSEEVPFEANPEEAETSE